MACQQTKRHLTERGITYAEVAVDSDEGIAVAAIELGFTTLPIVCASVDGVEQSWDGYRPDRIDGLRMVA